MIIISVFGLFVYLFICCFSFVFVVFVFGFLRGWGFFILLYKITRRWYNQRWAVVTGILWCWIYYWFLMERMCFEFLINQIDVHFVMIQLIYLRRLVICLYKPIRCKKDNSNIFSWLTVMEYLCYKWPRTCSTCRKHFPVLSSFMTYHRVCN